VATERSPVTLVYRRASVRLAPLRELLERHDFHAVLPPDALGEWEYHHDDGVRVRGGAGLVLVEADDGRRADDFDARHRTAFPSDRAIPDGGDAPERVAVVAGSDESGKGEREGPLAVAAVAVPVSSEHELLARGVRDSKMCTQTEIAALARWLAAHCAHAVEVVAREERASALRSSGGNETRLLAAMHVRVLAALHATRAFSLARVDRFAPNRPVAAALAASQPALIVDECARGERHVACAAASIVARAAVLRGQA
jgi:ribonuclease HII